MESTDRYEALGIPYPDPGTVCRGQCEGTGYVPVKADDDDPVFQQLWRDAEAEKKADDGWHFVKCPECDGTGRSPKDAEGPDT